MFVIWSDLPKYNSDLKCDIRCLEIVDSLEVANQICENENYINVMNFNCCLENDKNINAHINLEIEEHEYDDYNNFDFKDNKYISKIPRKENNELSVLEIYYNYKNISSIMQINKKKLEIYFSYDFTSLLNVIKNTIKQIDTVENKDTLFRLVEKKILKDSSTSYNFENVFYKFTIYTYDLKTEIKTKENVEKTICVLPYINKDEIVTLLEKASIFGYLNIVKLKKFISKKCLTQHFVNVLGNFIKSNVTDFDFSKITANKIVYNYIINENDIQTLLRHKMNIKIITNKIHYFVHLKKEFNFYTNDKILRIILDYYNERYNNLGIFDQYISELLINNNINFKSVCNLILSNKTK